MWNFIFLYRQYITGFAAYSDLMYRLDRCHPCLCYFPISHMAMPFANGVSAHESSQTKDGFYYITKPCHIHLKGERDGYYVDQKASLLLCPSPRRWLGCPHVLSYFTSLLGGGGDELRFINYLFQSLEIYTHIHTHQDCHKTVSHTTDIWRIMFLQCFSDSE